MSKRQRFRLRQGLSKSLQRQQKLSLIQWMLIGFISGLISVGTIIPIRGAIALHQAPLPQAIFVLGGDFDRMSFAAQFWRSHPNLDIWISDFPRYESENRQRFRRFNVPEQSIKVDGQATDTVTNFTTLVKEFSRRRLHHLYLITSDYHMQRARTIAFLVFGSQGIVTTAVPVPSDRSDEPILKVVRDAVRSLLWILTKQTGASLNPKL